MTHARILTRNEELRALFAVLIARMRERKAREAALDGATPGSDEAPLTPDLRSEPFEDDKVRNSTPDDASVGRGAAVDDEPRAS